MKTSELIGAELDYWVAMLEYPEGINYILKGSVYADGYMSGHSVPRPMMGVLYLPSTHWAQGGLIIEREELSLKRDTRNKWTSWKEGIDHPILMSGPTPLIAAMRAHVANKYGEEVEAIRKKDRK